MDPFFADIVRALNEQLDPQKFEHCALELVRLDYPGAVHVPGGNDAGYDGAIPDPDGPPIPLVSTTDQDAVRNLKKSLRSNKKSHRISKALFATSRPISAETRRKLEACASGLGYTLVAIYQQRDLAEGLYRSPRWCQDLLGLAGDPSALAHLPASTRAIPGRKLVVARANDLRWLRSASADAVLLGEPGVGKTFVLRRFARTDGGLFLIDRDRARLAAAIRSQRPRWIIVDDAHLMPEMLVSLRHLRQQGYWQFRILAACWPVSREEVQHALAVADKQVRELRLLTRDEIVRVIKAAGIEGPNGLIREIVDQAAGRAGLAVSLVHSILRGDLKRFMKGDELVRSLVDGLALLVGKEVKQTLAAFALSGNFGIHIEAAADFLRQDLAKVLLTLSGVASGGIVRPHHGRFSVAPNVLQQALVRDVFFNERVPFDCRPLISTANAPSVIEVLVGAKLRGGALVSSAFIQSLFPLDRVGSSSSGGQQREWIRAAIAFAYLGPKEARWSLDAYPEILEDAEARLLLLNQAPADVIPRLLSRAVGDDRPLNSSPNHSFRVLDDWISSPASSIKRSVKRRKCLFDGVETWLDGGGEPWVAVKAACIALHPDVASQEEDPGSGNKVTLSRGAITAAEANQLAGLWGRLRGIVRRAHPVAWKAIIDASWQWVHGPAWPMKGTSTADAMRRVMATELPLLVELASGHPAVLSQMSRLMTRLGLSRAISTDPDFEMLLDEDDGGFDKHSEEHRIATIAERWLQLGPRAAAHKVGRFLADAAGIDLRLWRLGSVCWELARTITDRVAWARVLGLEGATADLVEPFLWQAARAEEPEWQKLVAEWLEHEKLRQAAIAVAIFAATPDSLFQCTLAFPGDVAKCLERRSGDISVDRIRHLLTCPSKALASAAAAFEWRTACRRASSDGAKGTIVVRSELRVEWRQAMLTHVEREDLTLADVFEHDSTMALEWLTEQLKRRTYFHDRDYCTGAAIEALSNEQKREVLQRIAYGSAGATLISRLVDGDPALYTWFIANATDRRLHLVPLARDQHWDDEPLVLIDFVILALDAGHSARSVTEAIFCRSWGPSRAEAVYYQRWILQFDSLLTSGDLRLRKVGRYGSKLARNRRREARKWEQHVAIHGR